MQILAETQKPYIVESLSAPIGVSHYWTFSGHMLDFKLEPFTYIEETTGPTVRVVAQNLEMDLPASWQVLVVDQETYTIDCIPVAHCASFDHSVFLFSPHDGKMATTQMRVVDFRQQASCIHPAVPKGSALVVPTGPELLHGQRVFYGIVCGPYDLARWIGGRTVGEILT